MHEINQLYRRVRKLPIYIKENGTISSAFYRDSKGVSVSIDAGRLEKDIIEAEERLHYFYNKSEIDRDPEGVFKLIAIASVSKTVCDEKDVVIKMEPDEAVNPYHAILRKSETEIPLTPGQRKYLAKNTKIIKSYDLDYIKPNQL